MATVKIYGKDTWPYTKAAREAYARDGEKFDYFDVVTNSTRLQEMLGYSKGQRKVPVIVKGDGGVQIGFNGTWGV